MNLKSRLLSGAIVLGLLVGASGCSSTPAAKSLAKQSCADWGHSDGTLGKAVASLKNSAKLAARAAASDPRWTSLVSAWQDEEAFERDLGHAIGMNMTDDPKKWTSDQLRRGYEATRNTTMPPSLKAGRVIEAQCAIARS